MCCEISNLISFRLFHYIFLNVQGHKMFCLFCTQGFIWGGKNRYWWINKNESLCFFPRNWVNTRFHSTLWELGRVSERKEMTKSKILHKSIVIVLLKVIHIMDVWHLYLKCFLQSYGAYLLKAQVSLSNCPEGTCYIYIYS